jgi:hypothetical protein
MVAGSLGGLRVACIHEFGDGGSQPRPVDFEASQGEAAAPGLVRVVGVSTAVPEQAGNGGVDDPTQPSSSWVASPGEQRAGPAARGPPGRQAT